MLNIFLISILSLLIVYNFFFLFFSRNIQENYENYSDDPMILAQKNAGNIEDIKSSLDSLKKNVEDMKNEFQDVKDQTDQNTGSINGLLDGQKKSGEQINSKLGDIS
tara:strand:+ start:149 stop:469 length:321 start_codon:yes stop_codon:yes gene_type:complete